MRKLVIVIASVCLLLALPAAADTLINPLDVNGNSSGITYIGSVSGNTVTLTVQCTTLSICGNYYLGDQTLKFGNWSGSIVSSGSTPAGWDAQPGGQNNSNISGGCDGGSATNSVCWHHDVPLVQMGGTLFTFTATVTSIDSVFSPLHLQSLAFTTATGLSGGTHPHSTKIVAISQDMTGNVPEPGTMVLFGSGLLTAAGFIRRRLM